MLDHIQTTHSQALSNVSANANKTVIEQGEKGELGENQEQDFDFEDFLDIFNPLQHIPIVSNIYQEQMQDEISDDAKAVGDVLYGILTGGVFGVLSAVGNAILKQETDKDVGEHIVSFFDQEENEIPLVNTNPNNHLDGSKQPLFEGAGISGTAMSGETALSGNTALSGQTALSQQNAVSQQKAVSEQNQMSQKDDYWSLRMKQIFGDDEDFG